MAMKHLIIFAVVAAILPSLTTATEHIVGGDKGWNVSVDYNAWASDKMFHVGDTLVFKYDPPHNVYSVDAEGFKNCVASGNGWSSGNDRIPLDKPGKRWYICGFGKHCANLGQKLVISVMADAPTPAPIPPNTDGASGFALSWYHFAAAVATVAAMGAMI